MESSTLISLICRGLLFLFAVIVLGLSVSITNWWSLLSRACAAEKHCDTSVFGPILAAFEYCAFVGAFGIIDAVLGLAAVFVSSVPLLAVVVMDALAAIFFIAGGARLAAWMAGANCAADGVYRSICSKIEADAAFLWLGFIVLLVLFALMFVTRNKGGKSSYGASTV